MALTFSIKSQNGKIVKNISAKNIKRLLGTGKISDHDMISKDGTDQWHPVSRYKNNKPKAQPVVSASKIDTVSGIPQSKEPDKQSTSEQTTIICTDPGIYVLPPTPQNIQNVNSKRSPEKNKSEESEEQNVIITSFGMFWRREAIEWVSTSKLLGMQQIGTTSVDFCKQLGIYLLYDGREVIYVGRSTKRPLGRRLYEHTIDRLSARWDRFSWFGLLPVSDKGKIGTLPESYIATNLIPALEAILIEALEPRQNRKRGDDLGAVEYIQKIDPAIEKKRFKTMWDSVLNKL